jgi:uncharacterized protein (TIGR02147 family)
MRKVFEYSDYRKFLTDYYAHKKRENPNFSFRIFSELAGFKNKSVINNVLKGKGNLSSSSIKRVACAVGLKNREQEYFELLVKFNQAKTIQEKNEFYHQLETVKKYGFTISDSLKLRKEHYEFCSSVHHTIIRSIIDMYRFKDDYKWLARMVNPSIQPLKAKKSVQLLEKLGLIKKDKDGYYYTTQKVLDTGKEILNLGTMNFHSEAAKMAGNAITATLKKRKHFSGLTLGMSGETYKAILEKLDKFQIEVMNMAEQDRKADTAFQFNFQLFQASEKDSKKVRK